MVVVRDVTREHEYQAELGKLSVVASSTSNLVIITDAVGLRKYGLGMVRMGTRNLAPYLADGYLVAGLVVLHGVRDQPRFRRATLATVCGKETVTNKHRPTGFSH